jgi:Zn-dependent protease with chaperone function
MNTTNTNAGTGTYVISPRDLAPGWLTLYAMTLAAQVLAAAARFVILFPALLIVSGITGWSLPENTIAMILAFAPLILSLVTLVVPLDGWWWELTSGGRRPTQEEQITFDEAFGELKAANPDLRPPRRWFVIDEPDTNAAAYADTLRVDRGLLESPYLPCTIAHELGHLNTSDGRLASALNRMIVTPMALPGLYRLRSFPFRMLLWVASGEFGLWLIRTPWAMYWRSREFAADQYAARLGQGTGLATALQTEALTYDTPVPFMRFSAKATHPYTAQRIGELNAYQHTATPKENQ